MFPSQLYNGVGQLTYTLSKGDNWWMDAIAAYQAIHVASYEASKINLANPGTYDLTEGVAPSWSSDSGWFRTATNQYLKTGVVVTNSSWSIFVRYANIIPIATKVYMAIGTYSVMIMPLYTVTQGYVRHGKFIESPVSSKTSGVSGLSGRKYYHNGELIRSLPESGGTYDPEDLYLFDQNYLNAPYGLNGVLWNISAVAIFNRTLSAGEVATLSAAMAAL